ncbi:MAG: YihY family inner membrane protein [Advenella sp.]|uniref:YihY family inner membrane protein n=1 Tax=Advenella TaxID=290425 RepID=UPI00145F51A6|nr:MULTISPECIES: YihY family inner membrane protein [Advenella]MDD3759131.1 YihY family inner membrane protein [Advenella sp.]WKU18249.1 YihY family inner membrane protein [Advenella alkanexedens]
MKTKDKQNYLDQEEHLEQKQEALEVQEEQEQLSQFTRQSRLLFYRDAVLFAFTRLMRDNLTQVASSLTFTTVLAIVPLLAVILSLFTAFPLFTDFKESLDAFLTNNLMPPSMSENIMSYLNTFAQQASRLTTIGVGFLIVTSIMLMMTIDEALNKIWHIRRQRPISQRILVYWAILSLGPIMLGASLWATAFLAREKFGLTDDLSLLSSILVSLIPILLSVIGFTLLYLVAPNGKVALKDALIGGFTTALLLEIMKAGFTYYITRFPSYTLIYGTFATIPLFLLWIYLSWLVVLFGASVTAIAPQIRLGSFQHNILPGTRFMAAIRVLRLLHATRDDNPPGRSTAFLASSLKINQDELPEVLDPLQAMGYIVNTTGKRSERWALASSEKASLTALSNYFLFDRQANPLHDEPEIREAIPALILSDDSVKLGDIIKKP